MKKLYIPKGETRHYESVASGNIIVEGCLKVDGAIKARHIYGHGIIEAGTISARTIAAMDIEAAHITVEKLTAERVCAVEVHTSGAAAVSCCLEAQLVEAGKLIVADCEIGEMRCDDVVNLPAKHRSLFGTLLASFFRSLWCAWFCRVPKADKGEVMDADWRPHAEGHTEEQSAQKTQTEVPATAEQAQAEPPEGGVLRMFGSAYQDLENDFEFKRLAALYRFNKNNGFYLRLFPIEAEAAPLTGEAVRPAA